MKNLNNSELYPEKSGKKASAVGRTTSTRAEMGFSYKPERFEKTKSNAKKRVQQPDRNMRSMQSGLEGETKVRMVLSELPSNEYDVVERYEGSGVILKDTKSKSGERELDHIVLTNNGECIIVEVKNWSHCRKTTSRDGKPILLNNNRSYDFSQIRCQKEVINEIIPQARVISILCFANNDIEITGSRENDDCIMLKQNELAGFIQGISYNSKGQNGSTGGITPLEMKAAIYKNRLIEKELAKQRQAEKEIAKQHQTEMEFA